MVLWIQWRYVTNQISPKQPLKRPRTAIVKKNGQVSNGSFIDSNCILEKFLWGMITCIVYFLLYHYIPLKNMLLIHVYGDVTNMGIF